MSISYQIYPDIRSSAIDDIRSSAIDEIVQPKII